MTSARRRMSRYGLIDLANRWTFVLPAVILMAALLGYPILYTLQISFSELDLATFTPREWVGWEHYVEAFTDEKFHNSLVVTGIYLVFALPIQMILGFGIAFLVNAEWRGRGLIRALFLVPLAVAPVVAGGVWKMLLDPLWGVFNWIGGLFGLPAVDWLGDPTMAMATVIIIDTWRWTPFIILVASAALLTLPNDVLEAASVDGANWWHKLWHVSLPLLAPIIAATFVVRWLGAMKMFDIALVATRGGPGQATNVVNLYIYEQAFRSLHFGESAAMAVIVLVITMILMFVFLRGTRKLEEKF
ncbi:carbohydrate ABC transporter permease [Microbacterium sp. NPDC060132]|uniref:carbohydrate ABC transporter permease n=2 Tax=unclassified Microbacterium TaxID=2609290 RepID=UPI0036461C6B